MKIMVVSPHPDDETLGAGGTMFRLKQAGNQIYWLNVTDAVAGKGWSNEFIKKRKRQIADIESMYKFDGTCNIKFPPADLETLNKRDIIEAIDQYIKTVEPDWIILPDANDAHSDHRVVNECCLACSKVFRYPYLRRIMTMEILSETDFGKPDHPFVPNYFMDISECMDLKLQALQIYDTEMGKLPFPRNIEAVEALATLRGIAAGVRYAEAFKVIKIIE